MCTADIDLAPHTIPTTYWHALADGRVQCDVCPRACKMREGQRGLCFVRAAHSRRAKHSPRRGTRPLRACRQNPFHLTKERLNAEDAEDNAGVSKENRRAKRAKKLCVLGETTASSALSLLSSCGIVQLQFGYESVFPCALGA